jgi:outer membrane cobalamin receptor
MAVATTMVSIAERESRLASFRRRAATRAGTAIDREDIDALVQDSSHSCVAGLTSAGFDQHGGRGAEGGIFE